LTKVEGNKYNRRKMAVEYEFVFLTPTGSEEKELKEIFSELEKQLKLIKAKITDQRDWGSKDLTYQIKGNEQAKFWIWNLDVPDSADFSSLYTYLNRNETIIRYLLLKSS